MNKTYWKVFSSSFSAATAVYWFTNIIYAITHNFNDHAIESPSQIINVAFFFPNVLLLLPILAGIMIDYIGVIPILQYLSLSYLVGAVMFIFGVLKTNFWLVILGSLFFGFSLHLSFTANYVYLSNTFITKTNSIKHFRPILGIYFFLAALLLFIFSFFNDINFRLSFAAALTVISTLLCFFLRVKPALNESQRRQSVESTPVYSLVQSLGIKEEAVDETYIEYNEKFEEDEVNVEGFFSFLKTEGWKGSLKLLSLATIFGTTLTINRVMTMACTSHSHPSYLNSVRCGMVTLVGLGLAFWKLKKNQIERSLVITVVLNLLCAILAVLEIPVEVKIGFFVVQCALFGAGMVMAYLYVPFAIDLKIKNMGKGIGLFWWLVSVQMLASTWLNHKNLKVTNFAFIFVIILPTMLALTLFSFSVWSKSRTTLRDPSNSVAIYI